MKVGFGDKSGFVAMDLRILAFYKISSISAISSASSSATYLYFFVLVKLLDAELTLVISQNRKEPQNIVFTTISVPGALHSVTISVVQLFGPCMERSFLI